VAKADSYRLSDVQTVTVLTSAAETNGELLEVESKWTAGDVKPPAHFHPRQDERFELLEGELVAEVDGERRTLRPGDALEVPRGAVHEMWNRSEAPARARWEVRPALRTEAIFAAVDRSRRHRRNPRGGGITLVGAGRVLHAFPDELRLAAPQALARPLIAVLAAVARVRGYPRPA
jgi:mannose-6-phosphate isomerase-like protein (cupin superfamily)